jgi:hypothetical protein
LSSVAETRIPRPWGGVEDRTNFKRSQASHAARLHGNPIRFGTFVSLLVI